MKREKWGTRGRSF